VKIIEEAFQSLINQLGSQKQLPPKPKLIVSYHCKLISEREFYVKSASAIRSIRIIEFRLEYLK